MAILAVASEIIAPFILLFMYSLPQSVAYQT